MNDEAALRDKLRKIEALFAGAATAGRKPPPALRRIASAPGCERRKSARRRSRFGSAWPIRGRGRCSSRCAGGMACGRTVTRACAGKASWCGRRRRSSTRCCSRNSRRSTPRSATTSPRSPTTLSARRSTRARATPTRCRSRRRSAGEPQPHPRATLAVCRSAVSAASTSVLLASTICCSAGARSGAWSSSCSRLRK